MKVSRKKQKFNPVVIKLETQAEVDAMCAVVGKAIEADSGIKFNKLYQSLADEVSDIDYPLVRATMVAHGVMLVKESE